MKKEPLPDREEKVGPPGRQIDGERLMKACRDFESVLVHQVFKAMRQTVPQGNLLSEGPSGDLFYALFDEEVSKGLSKRGGLGLAKILYQNLGRQEEVRKALPGPKDFSPAGEKTFPEMEP